VHFSREWITELKSRASHVGAPRPYTTLQCVAAHLWRCITEARGLDGREATRIRIAVNGRARMVRPRVPEGYTGSVVLWARPATTARELLGRPLRYAVELISREVARIDDAYFRSFIDFASSGAVEKEQLVPTADAAEVRLPASDPVPQAGLRLWPAILLQARVRSCAGGRRHLHPEVVPGRWEC
jgi:hypothetical protein